MNFSFKNISLENLIQKYSSDGPYYTSYPSLSEWSEKIKDADFFSALQDGCLNKDNSFGVYVHFPYCNKKCYFCICNSSVTHNRKKISEFIDFSSKEIDLLKGHLDSELLVPKLKTIHLGGGSPNIMNYEEFDRFFDNILSFADNSSLEEVAIEVDVRTVDEAKLKYYQERGINRISLGIQDFNPQVQKAINRIQPVELVERLLKSDLRKGFKSINFDLLYGLPLQTRESFNETLDIVKTLSPDRITLLRYAHVPERVKAQRLINPKDLPDKIYAAHIFTDSIENLTNAGYDFIGIDHFAKPTDELSKAMKTKSLFRNFNGFTPKKINNLIGFGPSSTSMFSDTYFQNVYFSNYYKKVANNKLPLLREYKLNKDDMVRRDVINTILCDNVLDFKKISSPNSIDFSDYFKEEMKSLKPFIEDGMLEKSNEQLYVTPLGRVFIRHICRVFDNHLKTKQYKISGP